MHYTAKIREHRPPGSRPDRLADVRPQERVPRRIEEQIVDSVFVVPLLHTFVPQMADPLVKVLKILDNSLPDVEQVIEVPKIILHKVPQRSPFLEPQVVEQLVEVPGPDRVALALGVGAAGVAPATSSGPLQRGLPPAQGGIEILGSVTVVKPVDVLVNEHDKF